MVGRCYDVYATIAVVYVCSWIYIYPHIYEQRWRWIPICLFYVDAFIYPVTLLPAALTWFHSLFLFPLLPALRCTLPLVPFCVLTLTLLPHCLPTRLLDSAYRLFPLGCSSPYVPDGLTALFWCCCSPPSGCSTALQRDPAAYVTTFTRVWTVGGYFAGLPLRLAITVTLPRGRLPAFWFTLPRSRYGCVAVTHISPTTPLPVCWLFAGCCCGYSFDPIYLPLT